MHKSHKSAYSRRAAERSMEGSKVGKISRQVGTQHQRRKKKDGGLWRQHGTSRYIFLMVPFIEPKGMGIRGMQRDSRRGGSMFTPRGGERYVALHMCLTFKVIEGFYQKKDPVYPDE